MAKRKLAQPDIKLDLTPMIDVIFLLIIFFILAGKITAEISNEQITVPPTKTAERIAVPRGWEQIKIEVWGHTMDPGPNAEASLVVEMGLNRWESRGHDPESADAMNAYRNLRDALDQLYDGSERYEDPNGTGFMLPKVILELRADADTEYRVIQEIQQIATDGNDPYNGMMPKKSDRPRPFVHFHFTTRKPGE